jgi:hypothetical protein
MMADPIWQREIHIAQVDFEMMLEDLMQEWKNGKQVYSQTNGQPADPQQTVPVQPIGNPAG